MIEVWVLVIALITENAEVRAAPVDVYETMEACFNGRDELKVKLGVIDHFPVNTQAICIRSQLKPL